MCSTLFGILFTLCIHLTMYGDTVKDPFINDVTQRGINVYTTETDVQNSENFEWAVQSLLDELSENGINSISITWPIFTNGYDSNKISTKEQSLDPSSLEKMVDIAKARGFGVWIHPILDEKNLMEENIHHWRGNIEPSKPEEWFEEYQNMIMNYVEVSDNVDGIVIGTELWSMEKYHENWTTLIQDVRENFDGVITYASNRNVTESEFSWEIVDYMGVNFFPNLDLPDDATVNEIKESFQRDIDETLEYANNLNIPIIVTETGTTSQKGSFKVTGRWDHKTPEDRLTQKRYYEAICETWYNNSKGIYWWNTTLYPSSDNKFNPIGKSAEDMLDCG